MNTLHEIYTLVIWNTNNQHTMNVTNEVIGFTQIKIARNQYNSSQFNTK